MHMLFDLTECHHFAAGKARFVPFDMENLVDNSPFVVIMANQTPEYLSKRPIPFLTETGYNKCSQRCGPAPGLTHE